MFAEEDIEIEDFEVDDLNFNLIDFQFSCDYNLLGIKVYDGEWANLYVVINPFADKLYAEYELSQENYSKIHDLQLSDKDKNVLHGCAEKFIKDETGMTMKQYCKFLLRQENGKYFERG